MPKKLLVLFYCLVLTICASGQSYSKHGRNRFNQQFKLAVSVDGGYSVRSIANSATFFNAIRNTIKDVSYHGYKLGLQVLLTSRDDDFALNRLHLGIRGDYFKLAPRGSYNADDDISVYYVGLVSGGMYPIAKSAKTYIRLDLTAGYTSFTNSLTAASQKNRVSGSGLGVGVSMFVSFEVSKYLYLHLGGDLLTSKINSRLKTEPTLALNRASENVTFTTALISVTKIL